MIICFEGPSAVGKSTLAEMFTTTHQVIPEVNLLFERDVTTSKYWYLEKQVERFQICLESNNSSILDGDIFQPLWYNWVYGFPSEFLSKEETYNFYSKNLESGKVAFPDIYFVFQINEQELRTRKENDSKRSRRNFAKHLKFIQPQKMYFQFLKNQTDMEVVFLENLELKITQSKIVSTFNIHSKKEIDHLAIFKKIIKWLG